jgi:hypothetical protein
VRDLLQLLINAPHDSRVAMACVHHGNAATEIDVAVAFNIPDL